MYWNPLHDKDRVEEAKINRNMRCIEILSTEPPHCCHVRLIETWDVLKLRCEGGSATE